MYSYLRNFWLLCFALCISSFSNTYGQYKKENPSNNQQVNSKLKGSTAACQLGSTITELSLNNARTHMHTDGLIWSADIDRLGYEIPKGSGKSCIYSGGLWISGIDIYGERKQCAVKWKGARNYWPGPLIADGENSATTSHETCYQYDRHFEITRYQVEAFRDWFNTATEDRIEKYPDYYVPQIINEWPAHGDAASGYDHYLAPFWDNNDDGFYNPADGDYPFYDLDNILPCGSSRLNNQAQLRGDLTLWGITNDMGNIHQNPGGEGIGMEIRSQAFQFSTNDEVNDMSFYSYELINRSTYTLFDTYIGLYIDGDLGYAYDDYVGCDVSRGLGYYYNGNEVDGEGELYAYGVNPPAIGFDIFEGPYQDANGIDDCSSYDQQKNLICDECALNGNINGLNFGDGIVDNERWGMTNFMSYSNMGGTGPMPVDSEIYHYLRSIWKDGEHMRYGGSGHPSSGGAGPKCNFMFPGISDPCGWGQQGIISPDWNERQGWKDPSDRRTVQSSGPFTMEPGEVNNFTFGVVWVRSYDGGLLASVNKLMQVDDKAQALFDNCFRIIDGPDAPELTIREEDQKLTFHIWNKPQSNNYLESYNQKDPTIVCPSSSEDCDKNYTFQGYQVWQLRDQNISMNEVHHGNTDKARLVFQCDLRDGINDIVNFEWDQRLQGSVPMMMVEGADEGLEHSFVLHNDLFSKEQGELVNFKTYYYVAVAYAYNNYLTYNQNDPNALAGQKKPYLAGRARSDGPVRIYTATPHKTIPNTDRLIRRAVYGASPQVTQLEGHGNGRNVLDLDSASHDRIMSSGPPWKMQQVTYEAGKGPISVWVTDPLNITIDQYTVKFDSVDYFDGHGFLTGRITDACWYMVNSQDDTIFSNQTIGVDSDQLILEWGLSVKISQTEILTEEKAINNGFLEASIEFENPSEPWLWFVSDDDRNSQRDGPRNWIRAGQEKSDYPGDPESVYETVLGGTWAPYQFCYIGTNGVADSDARAAIRSKYHRLSSVDLYITADRSKWTRSPVIETTDDEALSINNAYKFYLRENQSIDKYGRTAVLGSGVDTVNVEAPNFISETGMGWFPGYAIDVETGERLNIIYGESSWLTGDNGADMMWNPSTREGSKLFEAKDGLTHEGTYFGGKHFIYIMGHNNTNVLYNNTEFPAYDAGRYFMKKMRSIYRYKVRNLHSNAMWAAIPILDERYYDEQDLEKDPYNFIKSDVKIRLRVAGAYRVGVIDQAIPDSLCLNDNKPMYTFDTYDYSRRYDENLAKEALDLIRIVPNPYYGESYSSSQLSEEIIKVTNLPRVCTISIYSLNGNLIKRIRKDSDKTHIDWDMKTDHGVNIAPGAYIFHINADGIGKKTLKWFGVWR